MLRMLKTGLARTLLALGCVLLVFCHSRAWAQGQNASSFDALVEQAADLEAGYYQQELELRREEIGLLRQELELKRYEIQLLRKQMEPKQTELYELRKEIEAEQERQVEPQKPKPTIVNENALFYRWCQVSNIPWRMVPSGGAVVQDGDNLGTFFKHAVLRDGVLFVWARC